MAAKEENSLKQVEALEARAEAELDARTKELAELQAREEAERAGRMAAEAKATETANRLADEKSAMARQLAAANDSLEAERQAREEAETRCRAESSRRSELEHGLGLNEKESARLRMEAELQIQREKQMRETLEHKLSALLQESEAQRSALEGRIVEIAEEAKRREQEMMQSRQAEETRIQGEAEAIRTDLEAQLRQMRETVDARNQEIDEMRGRLDEMAEKSVHIPVGADVGSIKVSGPSAQLAEVGDLNEEDEALLKSETQRMPDMPEEPFIDEPVAGETVQAPQEEAHAESEPATISEAEEKADTQPIAQVVIEESAAPAHAEARADDKPDGFAAVETAIVLDEPQAAKSDTQKLPEVQVVESAVQEASASKGEAVEAVVQVSKQAKGEEPKSAAIRVAVSGKTPPAKSVVADKRKEAVGVAKTRPPAKPSKAQTDLEKIDAASKTKSKPASAGKKALKVWRIAATLVLAGVLAGGAYRLLTKKPQQAQLGKPGRPITEKWIAAPAPYMD